MDLFLKNALDCSKRTTLNYSTSFSLGVRSLDAEIQDAIYAIYGFVRFADEIVDTFHDRDQREIFDYFKRQTARALTNGFSTNPILHSFQWVVNKYHIQHEHIDAFLLSMEMDLNLKDHTKQSFDAYVFGSAEAVGLMCLWVFYRGDKEKLEPLIEPARKLGSAFQKINFLRDLKDDYKDRGRSYFPDVDFSQFDDATKQQLEQEIEAEFKAAYKGIVQLEPAIRRGVLLAYTYYIELLRKIEKTSAKDIVKQRFRVSDKVKLWLLFKILLKNPFIRKK